MQIIYLSGTMCKQIFGLTQKIWTSPKYFGTHKRTRHKKDNDKHDLHCIKRPLMQRNKKFKLYQLLPKSTECEYLAVFVQVLT